MDVATAAEEVVVHRIAEKVEARLRRELTDDVREAVRAELVATEQRVVSLQADVRALASTTRWALATLAALLVVQTVAVVALAGASLSASAFGVQVSSGGSDQAPATGGR